MQVEIMPAKLRYVCVHVCAGWRLSTSLSYLWLCLLRLVEVLSHRIFDIYPASKPVNEVGGNRTLRLEVWVVCSRWRV